MTTDSQRRQRLTKQNMFVGVFSGVCTFRNMDFCMCLVYMCVIACIRVCVFECVPVQDVGRQNK